MSSIDFINSKFGKPKTQTTKKGFTLTEIAIVLGIMGLILGAIWVAAAGVYTNQRINQAQTGTLQVLQAIRTLYSQQATITKGDDTAALIGAGVIPSNLIGTGGNTMVSPWGGNMFVGGSNDGLGIVIEMSNMTAEMCVGVVAAIFGASHDRTLDTSSLVQKGNLTAFQTVTGLNGPINATAAPLVGPTAPGLPGANGTYCTAKTSTNSAILVFGLQG